jgi:hypothetical protein
VGSGSVESGNGGTVVLLIGFLKILCTGCRPFLILYPLFVISYLRLALSTFDGLPLLSCPRNAHKCVGDRTMLSKKKAVETLEIILIQVKSKIRLGIKDTRRVLRKQAQI